VYFLNETKFRIVVHCSGVVQGIGFRPFVYRIAHKSGVTGYVANLGDAGVRIEAEGTKEQLEDFLERLENEKPPLARYEQLDIKWFSNLKNFKDFIVAKSEKKASSSGVSYIPPDIALCDDCRKELFDTKSRRYLYPFIVCSACGPRFTVVEDLPYDRERTTMRDFPMCKDCELEYTNPLDRRYHAEPTCCPVCGPHMTLYSNDKSIIDTKDPIREAVRLLEEGYIIAIKGIGGTHIATMTTDDDVILKLRKRRRRPARPFAIMAKDVNTIKTFAEVSDVEEQLLTSYRRPIVALVKRDDFFLSKFLAPGLHTIGVMLPYSGIHELLLYYTKEPALVMTSGNYPSQPMAISNDEAFKQLKDIVDFFLLHNRRIVNRNDDSVMRIVDGTQTFLRRSRGFVPEPIKLNFLDRFLKDSIASIFAVGAELNVTVAILRGKYAYLSQHIGDVENLEMLNFLNKAVKNLMRLTNVKTITKIVSDLHPTFTTSQLANELAEKLNLPKISVQHHFAHIVSVMGEHEISPEESVVGIAIDGVGYGSDGKPWGGEILVTNYKGFKRAGHLELQAMPGGDLCAYYPARMLAGILSSELSNSELEEFLLKNHVNDFRYGEREINLVLKQINNGINITYTSSLGRVLDAISTALHISNSRTYEGEPAMKLESAAYYGDPLSIKLPIDIKKQNGKYVLRTSNIVREIISNKNYFKIKDLAASAQYTLAKGLAELAVLIAEEEGIDKIALSGGVAYNDAISRTIREIVTSHGFRFYRNKLVPPGDGGISFGQALIGFFDDIEI